MILIFGGAYQGKLDFAKKKFGVTDRQVFTCTEDFEADQEAESPLQSGAGFSSSGKTKRQRYRYAGGPQR